MGSRLEKNSSQVRKRIEAHTFEDEGGEEYEGSAFGGFNEYFRRKKIKLQNLDAQKRSIAGDKPHIFKGIVAHVNGYTQPSLNDLHNLVVTHGGGFLQYLDGKTTVTHIIAANLTPKKAIEFRRYRIVKPAWIVDSIAAGKLLPWENYRVLDEGVGQRLIGFDQGKVVSHTNTQSRGYRDQTNTSWYTSQVKSVADDIDDEAGAQFPSTQTLIMNGYGAASSQTPQRSMENDVEPKKIAPQSTPVSSTTESFELTSSLEDALDNTIADSHESRVAVKFADAANVHPLYEMPKSLIHEVVESATTVPTESPIRDKSQVQGFKAPSPSKPTARMTAEEHNALLLTDPHIRKSSTANPDFLKQYYSESRLHHLSAWKADLKARMQQLAAEKTLSQRQATKRRPGARRYVMHVDFDSFFCAVSLKTSPEYVDKPTVVAHGSGPGSEIASCNYPARAFGVKNGMWMKHALALCANLKVLPYDFPAYEEASRGFYEAILEVGGIIQSVSVDEALVDISSLVLPAGGTDGHGVHEGSIWREQAKADELADTLRDKIKEKTGCAVSIGIGGNILLAKVALRRAKPAGQYQIKPEEILDFIGELTVQDLPGVAYSIGGKLEEIGVKFVKDVRALSKERLITILGPKTGEKIWEYSRGIDRTEVGEQVIRKSVSAEVNWGIRFISQPDAEEFVQKLADELQRRLLEAGVKGRQMTMKIMRRAADAPMDPPKNLGHGKCDTFNKSIVVGVATNSAELIGREAISILRSYGFSPGELRGLGIQMTKLEPLKAQAMPDGSQRRINFTVPVAQRRAPAPTKSVKQESDDPIDELESPVKEKSKVIHPAMVVLKANEAHGDLAKPLNITGTQFLVPTQIDPTVLAALPIDVRSKLMAQSKTKAHLRAESPTPMSRSPSPEKHDQLIQLPSQLDPEVFDALPEDVKAEVLASYPSRSGARKGQSLLPQSPRKIRTVHLSKKQITPTKKRGRPQGVRNKVYNDSHSAYTQSNFLASRLTAAKSATDSDGGLSDAELDPEFLAALPEDMRAEVVAEHRRNRLARKSGLMTSGNVTSKRRRPAQSESVGQRKLRLPPRPARPTFTTLKLSDLPELRDTLSQWHEEFKDDGPHSDDVAAMERYLRRVVLDEKNLEKVVGVVRWLEWIIDDTPGNGAGKQAWTMAFKGIEMRVQEAVRERGLGSLQF